MSSQCGCLRSGVHTVPFSETAIIFLRHARTSSIKQRRCTECFITNCIYCRNGPVVKNSHDLIIDFDNDSNIDIVSAQPNDFRGLMQRYREIRAICFNGAASEKYFRRLVAPELELGAIEMVRLPSTSPANAGMTYAEKLNAWRRLLDFIEPAKS